MKGQEQLFSSHVQVYSTPQFLFDKLNNEFNFTLDPCADNNNYKCKRYYTDDENGLTKEWTNEVVFVNPPYNALKTWIKKCHDEFVNNKVTIVMLIPSRTDTAAFHEYIAPVASQIRFLKGRLKFNTSNSAPFPSAIIVFNNVKYDERVVFVDYR